MIPLETIEQQQLAKRLKFKKYMFFKVPSETYTKSWKQKNKNKLEGVTRGFPDTVIILKRGSLLFIEMKRQKKILKSGKIGASPSVISEEQLEWQEKLNEIENVSCEIAYGVVDAVRIVQEYENL